MIEQWEEGFVDGMDEACRQVNEYLEDAGLKFRYVNAGLNTVCQVDMDDPSYALFVDMLARKTRK